MRALNKISLKEGKGGFPMGKVIRVFSEDEESKTLDEVIESILYILSREEDE